MIPVGAKSPMTMMTTIKVQSSALVGNRLYFFGSAVYTEARDNLFLDVTLSTLNTSNPLWFSNVSVPTDSALASACVGGPNKNAIYLLEHLNATNAPRISSTSFDVLNDIFILDTLLSTWAPGSIVGAPTGRVDFSATLLNNGLILYIGGIGGGDSINMAEISIFNTNNNSWFPMNAVGDTITSRSSHSAVLSPDGHVIIYGGNSNNIAFNQSQQLATLDTTVNPYKWTKKSLNVTQIQTVIASESTTLSTGVIVAIPIVSIAVLAIIGFTGYWLYKRNKQNDIIHIAGSK
ncbi:9621_t:CDS:2, partial [Racocetra persica]